jgi:hypothetical protein
LPAPARKSIEVAEAPGAEGAVGTPPAAFGAVMNVSAGISLAVA